MCPLSDLVKNLGSCVVREARSGHICSASLHTTYHRTLLSRLKKVRPPTPLSKHRALRGPARNRTRQLARERRGQEARRLHLLAARRRGRARCPLCRVSLTQPRPRLSPPRLAPSDSACSSSHSPPRLFPLLQIMAVSQTLNPRHRRLLVQPHPPQQDPRHHRCTLHPVPVLYPHTTTHRAWAQDSNP